jgi:uncharacterized membrane protein
MEVVNSFENNNRVNINRHAGDNRNTRNGKSEINLNEVERIASALGGGILTIIGITKGGIGGLALTAVGGGLAWRGVSGHCNVYKAIGVNTADQKNQRAGIHHGEGIKVERSVTINKSPEELYRFWSNLENLPRFMEHLESVRVLDDKISHWIAKGPLGTSIEWDAEIINKKENELIAWRSVEGATVPNAGSVRFEGKSGAIGTVVKVSLSYAPPGGIIAATFAKLFGEEPQQQVEEDLRRFKQVMETGETASVQGQPSGRGVGATK